MVTDMTSCVSSMLSLSRLNIFQHIFFMCLDHGFTTLTSPVCGKARRCCCLRACVRGEEAKKPLPRRPGARGGAGRGGMASNGPQVRWRPDNTVTQHQHTQHTPSPRPGGPHPSSRLGYQATVVEPSRTDARIHTSYMTHSERNSWNGKRVSHVCHMSHTVSPMPVSVLKWCNNTKTI